MGLNYGLLTDATTNSAKPLKVIDLNRTIDDLNDSVVQLEIDNEVHKERGTYLQEALHHNTSLLKTTLIEQQQYKAQQDLLMYSALPPLPFATLHNLYHTTPRIKQCH
jgi:hypothetical protein